jgi:hypothetical protein
MAENVTFPQLAPGKAGPEPDACRCHETVERERPEPDACRCHRDAPAEVVRVQRFTLPPAGAKGSPARPRRPSRLSAILGVVIAVPLLVLGVAFLLSGLLPGVFVTLALFLPALAPLLLVGLGVLLTAGTPLPSEAPVREPTSAGSTAARFP